MTKSPFGAMLITTTCLRNSRQEDEHSSLFSVLFLRLCVLALISVIPACSPRANIRFFSFFFANRIGVRYFAGPAAPWFLPCLYRNHCRHCSTIPFLLPLRSCFLPFVLLERIPFFALNTCPKHPHSPVSLSSSRTHVIFVFQTVGA
jgi:hypothetical protein